MQKARFRFTELSPAPPARDGGLLVFHRNPEDDTAAAAKISTPLKDRIGAEIRTHIPASVAARVTITAQEALGSGPRFRKKSKVPPVILRQVRPRNRPSRPRRTSAVFDRRSGVSPASSPSPTGRHLPKASPAAAEQRAGPRQREKAPSSPVSPTSDGCPSRPSPAKWNSNTKAELKGARTPSPAAPHSLLAVGPARLSAAISPTIKTSSP